MEKDGTRLADLHKEARLRLSKTQIETPDLDARLLVEWVTGCDRLEVIRNPAHAIDSQTAERLHTILARRINGESVHRIIGRRAFHGIELGLSPDTLEPRPDTEALVELAIPFLRQRIEDQGVSDLIDLGTGTGAIALALLDQLRQLRAVGVDISTGALDTARDNAQLNNVSDRFAGLHSDWFSNVSGSFDMIISNPPYIPTADLQGLQTEVARHDPVKALDGGPDGLAPYRIIARQSRRYLRQGGAVALEVGAEQRSDVEAIFSRESFALVTVQKDIGGHERALLFTPLEKD
jgi:release factor glutamine methyltransferase